ncbi:MAG: LysE family translocator [Bacteroidaceae bacterium]|nr:LysE family translocator [Bacteroidaceae bacterium]
MPQYATFQDWLQDTSYIEMIIKGLIIGIIASAPMGPVGILCIQRTLNKGRWEGFATGVGASLSDIIYAIITGFGLKFVIDIIEDPVIALWLKTIGGLLLFLFGIYTFMSKPKETVKAVKRNKGTLLQNFLTGFAVTVSNPLIIFLFVATFAMFTFIIVENFIAQIIGYIFIVVGAMLWWYVLTWLVDKVRNNYNMRIIWIINKTIGIAVMIGAVLMILYTITGHSIDLSDFRFPFNN